MIRYSIKIRDQAFVEDHGLLLFDEKYEQKFEKNLIGKYSQKVFDHAKKPAIDALKAASSRAIQKMVEASSDLIGNKIANKITKVSRISPQNISETVINRTENL